MIQIILLTLKEKHYKKIKIEKLKNYEKLLAKYKNDKESSLKSIT